jgi:hypothetical protein
MSQNADHQAENLQRAAEREHTGSASEDERRKSDSEGAEAHHTLTRPELRRGHPSNAGRRDKPVDEERDKDLKDGGIEGAARRTRGRP